MYGEVQLEDIIDNINMEERKQRSQSLDLSLKDSAKESKSLISKTKYKYKKKPIGKGSFATVFLAIDKFGEKFALKRIELNKLDPSRLDKFLFELDISKKLVHPNIVKCVDTFKTDIYWFIINEFCDAHTFLELNKEFKNFDYEKRETYGHYYLSQLKDALYYLHQNNIIHRDLKPANILIKNELDLDGNTNEIVKLADFGLARYFENKPQNETGYDDMISTICGSPMYMAPELLTEEKYNIKADLWSFGVIMYEMLYGTNPYNAPKNIPELKKFIESKKIYFDDKLSPLCVDLMKKLLKVNPAERISWDDFFNHEWFSLVLVSESEESDSGNTVNTNDITNSYNTSYDSEFMFNQDYETIKQTPQSNMLTKQKHGHIIGGIGPRTKSIDKNISDGNERYTQTLETENTIVTHNTGNNNTGQPQKIKTIEFDKRDREEAFRRARSMKDTFQLLKDRGKVFSDISKDPEMSPYSSGDMSREKRSATVSSILYDLSENFIDKHFGDSFVILKDDRSMIDESYIDKETGQISSTNDGSQTNNTNKPRQQNVKVYKESVSNSVIRILSESVGYLFSQSKSY